VRVNNKQASIALGGKTHWIPTCKSSELRLGGFKCTIACVGCFADVSLEISNRLDSNGFGGFGMQYLSIFETFL